MSRKRYTLACIAGHGVGPELLAEASRAVEAAASLHGFLVDRNYVPFGVEALMRFGHPSPPSSRRAVLAADAVLVAPGAEELLEEITRELDLRCTLERVRFDGRSELSVLAPHAADAWPWTIFRAFEVAAAGRARVAFVGMPTDREGDVAAAAAAHNGFEVEHLSVAAAMAALVQAPQHFDVVVVPPELAASVAAAAACTAGRRVAAWGRLAETGPSVFGAAHDAVHEDAGQGVADPAPLLLAAALALCQGLGERSAGSTLARALGRAPAEAAQPSTRRTADAVLAEMPRGLAFEFVRAVS